ncbi:hypothetical protein SYN65AY6LI_02210 [Synechococcus sp. 65AY6Li]|uniref:hypothetical protein n=1 Tax=Synechococcus sp. 65AY6Li TaxID=1351840 RepID=UPI000C19C1EE|nr:hypothetical protein [Synechococcus sp. 65AY6Li]PIK93111.1 hypothetical protein SYN65AY6LI_02210 [Synechococcus sp. 65AY6Li]
MSFPPSHLLQHSRQHLVSFAVQVLLPAVALTLLQIFLISFWSQEDDYASIFKGLTQWDSHWYLGIVRRGYQFVGFDKIAYEQSNVAFFPGYPLAVAAISRLLGVDPELGLYLTAQLFCWLMWIYFFLFCRRWQIPPLGQVLASLIILVYPSSFYLVVGYSESLFLASLLGFFYWSMDLNAPWPAFLAGIHGLVMSATRIVGLPVALVPLLRLSHPWFWTASAVVLALLGGLGFFLYCQLRFGRWDLYLEMQRYFGPSSFDYLAIIRPRTYAPLFSSGYWQSLLSFSEALGAGIWAISLSQLFVLLTLGSLVITGLLDGWSVLAGKSRRWQERLGFHLAAWAMFSIAVAGMSAVAQRSMIRYCLPVHILQVLAWLHGIRYTDFSFIPQQVRFYLDSVLRLGYWILALVFFALNQILTWRYVQHLWVA